MSDVVQDATGRYANELLEISFRHAGYIRDVGCTEDIGMQYNGGAAMRIRPQPTIGVT
jgi:hypothetical protein